MEPKDNLFSERNMQREKRAVHSIKLLNVMMWQVIGQHRIFTWKKSDGEVFHVSPRVLLKLQGNPWDRTSPYYFDTNDTLLCRWHWFKLNPYTIHHQLNICIISILFQISIWTSSSLCSKLVLVCLSGTALTPPQVPWPSCETPHGITGHFNTRFSSPLSGLTGKENSLTSVLDFKEDEYPGYQVNGWFYNH